MLFQKQIAKMKLTLLTVGIAMFNDVCWFAPLPGLDQTCVTNLVTISNCVNLDSNVIRITNARFPLVDTVVRKVLLVANLGNVEL